MMSDLNDYDNVPVKALFKLVQEFRECSSKIDIISAFLAIKLVSSIVYALFVYVTNNQV